MKKLFFSLILAGMLCACGNSPEKQAENRIKQYLKENLNDPSSYESISFGTLDSTFSSVYDDPAFKELSEKNQAYRDSSHKASIASIYAKSRKETQEINLKRDEYDAIVKELEQKRDEIRVSHKGDFYGWSMTHKYRAKNGVGALGIDVQTFYLDKELTTIRNVSKVE